MSTAIPDTALAPNPPALAPNPPALAPNPPALAPNPPAPGTTDLADLVRARGVLVSLEITTWSARRIDRRVTQDATVREGAVPDAGRFNKHLLGGTTRAHADTQAAASAARALLYSSTLPWGADGTRLLPTANYFAFAADIRDARARFRQATEAFLNEYPALREEAEDRLGSMYDPADYPAPEEIGRKFRFRVAFTPVPAASDIRLDLPPEVTAHIEQSVTARVERTVQDAVRSGWDRLFAAVERIRDRVREIADPAGPAGRLHATLFETARDTADVLRRLNILQDPALDALAERVMRELGSLDAKTLRQDGAAMQGTVQAADAILQEMVGIYGGPRPEGAQ